MTIAPGAEGEVRTGNMGAPDKLLILEDVSFSYRPGSPVLQDVSLDLDRGELVALLGASGSGKSTLLSVMGLLARPQAGRVVLSGQETLDLNRAGLEALRNRALGFVFQHHFLLPDFRVEENVAMPHWIRTGRCSSVQEEIRDLLDELGILHLRDRYPHELSGGERQRVAIARAISHRPELVLADEPTGSLDTENGDRVLELLFRARTERKTTVLLVTHNPGVADRCDRSICIQDGHLA